MNRLNILVAMSQGVPSIVAVFAFATGKSPPEIGADDAANARLYSPVLALCAAARIMFKGMINESERASQIRTLLMGLISLVSAYHWIASAAEASPTEPKLFIDLAVALGFAAVVAVLVMLPFVGFSRDR